MSATTTNQAITDRNTAFGTYITKRSRLISAIASYEGNSSNALLIKGVGGTDWWIIFVTNKTLAPQVSTTYYDITIKGNGLHIVYKSDSPVCNYTASQFKGYADTATADLLVGINRLEFYGKSNSTKMQIKSVVQNSTVSQEDDIVDIDSISLHGFDNLRNTMAINGNFMNI